MVEHPELVAERFVRLAERVGRENVMGGTDCGFAQGAYLRRVHPSIQWAKLQALAEGARLATQERWSRSRRRCEAMTRDDVLLVGSLPFADAEQAFRAAGPALRGHVAFLPDGETAERINWVGMLPVLVFSKHPDIQETLARRSRRSSSPTMMRSARRSRISKASGTSGSSPARRCAFDDLQYGRFASSRTRCFGGCATRA